MRGERKSSLGNVTLKMLALEILECSMSLQELDTEYSVTYAPGSLGYWAIAIYYTISFILKNST